MKRAVEGLSMALRASARGTVSGVLLAIALAVAVSLFVFSGSELDTSRAVQLLLGMGALALYAWLGTLRRWIIFCLFMTASIDISKALIAPEGRFYSPGLYLLAAQALLMLWLLVWAGRRLILLRGGLPFSRVDGWALGFLALVWWGALRSPAGSLALASAVTYSLCVLSFYMASHALEGVEDLRLVLRGALAGFALQALYTGLQFSQGRSVTLPGIKFAVESGAQYGDLSAYRPVGLFIHPNSLADWVLWLLLPALAFVLLGRRRVAQKVWWTALAVLSLGTGILLVTLSRGGWAAYVLGILVLGGLYWQRGIVSQRHVWIAIGVAAAAVVVVFLVYPQVILRLTEPDDRSTESRLLLNDQAFMIIRQHLWTGIGYGAYNWVMPDNIPSSWSLVSPEYQKALLGLIVHNHYLLLTAELGLPAVLYFIVLLARLAWEFAPARRWRDPALLALGAGLCAAIVGHMLYLASDNYYADIRIFLLWTCAGLLQALSRWQPLLAQPLRPTPPPREASA